MSLTTSLQVCMDSSLEWLQFQESEGGIMGSSSSSSEMENILTCSRPVLERRMRPQHEQALECPRCHSTHTKFCYYNNYSLSQPRYFCKSCRRYWTNGGTLRNIPVGGGCRKNKKSSSPSPSPNKKLLSSNDHHLLSPFGSSSSTSANPTDFQLMSFPEVMPHHHQFHVGNPSSANFIGIENPTPIDFMDTKYGSLVDNNNNNQDFLGNNNADEIMGMMNNNTTSGGLRFGAAGVCSSSYGVMCVDGNSSSSTTAMLPYPHLQNNNNAIDDNVKPNADALSLEWQDQGSAPPKNSFAYINEMGSWTTGFMR